jgi:hypothetical protein
VTDEGIGISEEDKQNLFQMFFKTTDENSRRMNKGSHGIGLNVCKRFAKALGGDLYLNEDYKEGCQFVLQMVCKRFALSNLRRKKSEEEIGQLFKVYESLDEEEEESSNRSFAAPSERNSS